MLGPWLPVEFRQRAMPGLPGERRNKTCFIPCKHRIVNENLELRTNCDTTFSLLLDLGTALTRDLIERLRVDITGYLGTQTLKPSVTAVDSPTDSVWEGGQGYLLEVTATPVPYTFDEEVSIQVACGDNWRIAVGICWRRRVPVLLP